MDKCFLSGRVVRGEGIGSRFGVSTANLDLFEGGNNIDEGVYVTRVRVQSQDQFFWMKGVMHFGRKKTFDDEFSVEVHVLDFSDDLYNQELEVEVLKKLREVRKFSDVHHLFFQIESDIVQARKYFLRESVFLKWDDLNDKQREKMIPHSIKKIVQNRNFLHAKNIFLYAPMNNEIGFVENLCKQFPDKVCFFPKIEGAEMNFYRASWNDLILGKYGILEPLEADEVLPKKEDVMFVPAVAIDYQLNRLGKGGGFYDRFLLNVSAYKIAVIPKFSYVEILPIENHDQKVDEVMVIDSE